LAYKRGAVPQPQGTRDDGQRSPSCSPPSPRYWHFPQSIPLGLGGRASSPSTLVAPPLRAPRCNTIQCPEHTTAGRTAPAGTRINSVSLVASTGPSRGRSQRSLLVSVGTTFRTDKEFLPWVAPTVGCTARWGQIPTAVGHDGRNTSAKSPSAVPRDTASVVAHGGRVLASWGTR
jgi:hypothetical protein